MRSFKTFFGIGGLIVAGGLTTMPFIGGQERPAATPATRQPSVSTPAPGQQSRDVAKWPYFPQQIFYSGQRGGKWLLHANGADGRFLPGFVPALRAPLDGDSYFRQAGAAGALAEVAKYFKDEQAAVVARQAVLTLLVDTAEDPKDKSVLVSALPGGMANPLGAAGMLVQAIHELPEPGKDVLDKADQLCNFIRHQCQANGSLGASDLRQENKTSAEEIEAGNNYAGEALYALMCSQQHRPAPWKLEVVRKALPYYQARWRGNKGMAMVPRHTAAYAEAFLQTKDKAFADFVFEMNDWLCDFQFQEVDPRHPLWAVGGFMGCVDGKPMPMAPHAISAAYAESLAAAARVARQMGDLARWERYKLSVERCLQFLTTLQYTEANLQHFTDWYRPTLLGALHASHTDSNIRLDYTSQAVCAMIGYLKYVADVR